MLGLGNSICAAEQYDGVWTPETVNNLVLWLKFNTNIEADQNGGGTTTYDPVHTSNGGDMVDADRINAWNAFGDTSINAVQTVAADKPRWEVDAADLGGVKFTNGIKYMNLSSTVTIAANADFSLVFRAKATDTTVNNFIGSSDAEFFRLNNAREFRINIDGSTVINFGEASVGLATDTYYTFILSRTNGATGDLNMFVHGGAFDDKDWDAAENATDASEVVLDNLGADKDDSDCWNGFMKDVLIYNGTALTASDREELYTYIEAQE